MESLARTFLSASFRQFFKLLYTTFAWAYDLVSWTTSMGQWKTWLLTSWEVLPDGNILEVGHGPGHLLLKLSQNKRVGIGVDASAQMGRMATKRLHKHGYEPRIIQALSQRLPLTSSYFAGVVSTFPSEYIIDPDTISEIWRVLQPDGIFVIISSAQITGRNLPDRFAALLFRISGQSAEPGKSWNELLDHHGFSTHIDHVSQSRATVIRVIAHKNVLQNDFAPSSTQA
jgi:ubiquinone/menaquinone biosynthesis C-methylase UbiE